MYVSCMAILPGKSAVTNTVIYPVSFARIFVIHCRPDNCNTSSLLSNTWIEDSQHIKLVQSKIHVLIIMTLHNKDTSIISLIWQSKWSPKSSLSAHVHKHFRSSKLSNGGHLFIQDSEFINANGVHNGKCMYVIHKNYSTCVLCTIKIDSSSYKLTLFNADAILVSIVV